MTPEEYAERISREQKIPIYGPAFHDVVLDMISQAQENNQKLMTVVTLETFNRAEMEMVNNNRWIAELMAVANWHLFNYPGLHHTIRASNINLSVRVDPWRLLITTELSLCMMSISAIPKSLL